MRIVVLGGLGNFGARICRALVEHPGIEVIAVSRNPDQGPQDICTDSRIQRADLDTGSPYFKDALQGLWPHVVIHCAGPFQGQDYRVVAATVSVNAHYIDLADGRDFVAHFAANNDTEVSAADLLAVSGASTVPALSSAVVDHLARRFERVKEIQIVIAPAQRAQRGAATLAGVFSYAGKPFKWLSGGEWDTVYGWQELRRIRIEGVGTRWAAACDVPDLELFPARYPGVETVEFRAALEVGAQHGALWSAAMLRRGGLRLPIERWGAPLDQLASWLNGFGSEAGGMLVSVAGTLADGRSARMDWHLAAPENHGPEIPCMAAVLIARKLANGELTARGALPCTGLLTLAEFEPEFARWGISTVIEEIPS